MGLLIALLSKNKAEDVFLDLEKAEPASDRERALYNKTQRLLDRAPGVYAELENYASAQDLVRVAMRDANPETEGAAFAALLPTANKIKIFYEFARDLEASVAELLQRLASPVPNERKDDGGGGGVAAGAAGGGGAAAAAAAAEGAGEERKERKPLLADQQSLAKQLAHLMDFALRFDVARMMRPALSNDFSFYRRLVPKNKNNPDVIVGEEDANQFSFFVAEVIPMTTRIAKAAINAYKTNEHVAYSLAVMSNSCFAMLRDGAFAEKPAIEELCTRCMVGALLAYDHCAPLGAFVKKAPLETFKICQRLSQKNEGSLMNAVRFSSRHFNDDSTPSNISALFD